MSNPIQNHQVAKHGTSLEWSPQNCNHTALFYTWICCTCFSEFTATFRGEQGMRFNKQGNQTTCEQNRGTATRWLNHLPFVEYSKDHYQITFSLVFTYIVQFFGCRTSYVFSAVQLFVEQKALILTVQFTCSLFISHFQT